MQCTTYADKSVNIDIVLEKGKNSVLEPLYGAFKSQRYEKLVFVSRSVGSYVNL